MRMLIKEKNKIIAVLIFTLIVATGCNNYTNSKKNTDILNDILSAAKGNTVEYGIRVSFEIKEDGKQFCLDLFKKLHIDVSKLQENLGENCYSLEFNKNEEKGYIECVTYDNHNVVTLNIIKKENENSLNSLKTEIQDAVKKSDKDMECFFYLKAKLKEENINEINDRIEVLLKQDDARNINSVRLDNGLSTVAYTKHFKPMKNNGELMDLNYAVCSYDSGNYIMIGTPIIIEAY